MDRKMTFKQAVESLLTVKDLESLGYDKGATLYNVFMEEHGNFSGFSQMAVTEWVKGLPTALTFPFNNYDILSELAKLGHKSVYNKTDRIITIIDNYWLNIGYAAYMLMKKELKGG